MAYTTRSMFEGTVLAEETGLDIEAAEEYFTDLEKFYLNAPGSEQASAVTLQLFRESDGHVERELTFD